MKRSKLYYLTHPSVAVPAFLTKVSDRYAIEQLWKNDMDYPLNLRKPQTFCEKLNWLKLHDRNSFYHKLVDKHEVKEWVAEKIGAEFVVKTYALYNSVDEIDFNTLPNSFVLKCTHNSGGTVICQDKQQLDLNSAIQKLSRCVAVRDYYKGYREWAYKGVKPRIIAEELLEDDTFEDLVNYKFCFLFSTICTLFS